MTEDYHEYTYPDMSKEARDYFNVGPIYLNMIECKKCGYLVRSRNRHDYRKCKCGAVGVDGGSFYLRRTGNPEDIIERSVMFNSERDND